MSTTRDPVFGCLLATGRFDADGYAYCGKSRAHIVAWTRANGPIAAGLELDHLCRRRNCTALHHMETVTPSENGRRKSWAYRAKRKTCARGHDLGVTRVVTPERGIVCRQCNRDASATSST